MVDHLPPGWRYDGKIYYNTEEKYTSTHPNLDYLVELFVQQENDRI